MSAYVKGTEIASVLHYKASVNAYPDLSAVGQKICDMYNIKTAGGVDLSGFVQTQAGKGLSTNDFTDELKNKLETLGDATIETITEAEIREMFE